MTDKEKLIELILQSELEAEKNCVFYSRQSRIKAGIVADFLIENGVIVPPVNVGKRRIDDLGRIHIPKDVRQSLSINYGDVMSINVSDTSIILKKEREQK